jgi:hypothetical protein
MSESSLARDWHPHPKFAMLATTFGANDVVGEGNSAVSAVGCDTTLALYTT